MTAGGFRQTPAQALRILQAEHRFKFRKSLGQHFLVDPRALDGIVRALAPGAGETVVEVGPGAGFLTERLLETGARVIAVEVDPVMADLLARHTGSKTNLGSQTSLGNPPALTIVRRDILSTELDELLVLAEAKTCRVVGNLPYQITSPVLFKFLAARDRVTRMVFTVQREVGTRMAAGPGSKDYGSLSVAVAYAALCESLFGIAPAAFIPRPRVQSVVVRLTPLPRRLDAGREARLFALVRAAFQQRRKQLVNSVAEVCGDKEAARALLAAAGIAETRRGETLNLSEFELLAAH
ncbi:MAG: 16S rRNA (adenine(1518)-N(6)/adenine(1519)-N(6))-dimethyltransferase RsmA [Candidatus Coatesbacteria bacterium]